MTGFGSAEVWKVRAGGGGLGAKAESARVHRGSRGLRIVSAISDFEAHATVLQSAVEVEAVLAIDPPERSDG
jgi:hypothetical protein